MKLLALGLGLTLLTVSASQAQTPTHGPSSKAALAQLERNMPSEREFSELLAKADEKVSAFEAAMKNAKLHLDRIDPKYATNYLDAASTAHLLISKTIQNGASAYALVGVLTTLDDLSLDAANGSAFLLAADADRVVTKGASPDAAVRNALLELSSAGTACNDIAELIFHATMRLIAAEETALKELMEAQN
jgi:hypothetical protein